MKAKLEFELPAEEEQFNAATKAMDWALLVWDLDQQCRDWSKYEKHGFNEVQETLKGVRRGMYEAMVEKGGRVPS